MQQKITMIQRNNRLSWTVAIYKIGYQYNINSLDSSVLQNMRLWAAICQYRVRCSTFFLPTTQKLNHPHYWCAGLCNVWNCPTLLTPLFGLFNLNCKVCCTCKKMQNMQSVLNDIASKALADSMFILVWNNKRGPTI